MGFGISELGFVTMKVYNSLGKDVITLIDENKQAGYYQATFDGSNLPSGMYFYRLSVDGNVIDTKRMALVK
ncbi:MAG: T9SS type A sorting domain-containing protein [bacterium]|nr:T9SS type A sorting domain-containing protein [bacterium]